MFRIELFPYCPVGNGAQVSAWDIDELCIYGGCVPMQSLDADITGIVITKTGQGIPNVEMQLSGNSSFANMDTTLTSASGRYSFPHRESGNGYYMRGYKNDDILNGVSAIDLIHLQKHLLGITPFTTLHQYIAADVNHSGSVNVLDLVILQKVLLGSITTFPGNTSWRFGSLPQDMSGQDIRAFKEVYNIEHLEQGPHLVDFVGIKIGDLNGDAKLGRMAGRK
ncbi:MAG: dockerin type I domain-containing protein [Saprospiraceae bacterium]|nr:dockerin type I domain-containing protein [Saprospiraceae bacterium]